MIVFENLSGCEKRIVIANLKIIDSIVMIRPKAPFRAVFLTAVTREWSGVELIRYEPQENSPEAHTDPCSWWRRGRVELPVQRTSS
jgi:hypothetical protein